MSAVAADGEKYFLGSLCKRQHDDGDGQSLRYRRNGGCVRCIEIAQQAAKKSRLEFKAQTVPSEAAGLAFRADLDAAVAALRKAGELLEKARDDAPRGQWQDACRERGLTRKLSQDVRNFARLNKSEKWLT